MEEIPEDATALECDAIVIPAAYISRENSEAPLSEASHEFTQTQVDAIVERGLTDLPLTIEHMDEEEIMGQCGNVESVWKNEDGDLCARFRVPLNTIPSRAMVRMIQSGAKGSVSLRHDIVPTGHARTDDSTILRVGKQIRELSLCRHPRREGAVITNQTFSRVPLNTYNTANRINIRAPLVSSAASLVFTDDGSYTTAMSETEPATAAPAATETTPAAAAEVIETPAKEAVPAVEAVPAAAPEAAAPETAAPPKPDFSAHADPMVSAMAQAMMGMKDTWSNEMTTMKNQISQLTELQLANEQRRQREIAATEAAERERAEKEAAIKAEKEAEENKRKAVECAREEARLGQLYKEYIDSSMDNAEAANYIKGLRNAGDAIFNRQVQLLESKASAKASQAQQWLSYMTSNYSSGARTAAPAPTTPVIMQSAASRIAAEPAAKRRIAEPAPTPVVDIPVVGADQMEQQQEPRIEHINDVFRANPCMGYQEGLQLGQRLLNQDYIVRSQASLQVEAPSGSTESVQLKETNPLLLPDIMQFSPEFARLWHEAERTERQRGGRTNRSTIAMVPVKAQ